jgi:hypothetical protein
VSSENYLAGRNNIVDLKGQKLFKIGHLWTSDQNYAEI